MREASPPFEPRSSVLRLYRDLHGYYDLSPDEELTVLRARSSSMYGEIMPAATEKLLDYLRLGKDDVLYDLGSGLGKFVVQAAMTVPLRRCVGIELAASRARIAREILMTARQSGLLRAKEVSLIEGDFMAQDISDATVIYTCSTAFPSTLMDRMVLRLATLQTGLILASVRDLDDNPYFEQVDELRLDMSWKRRSRLYIYRLLRSRRI